MVNSRQKGARCERELAGELRRFGFEARRGQQRSGLDQADVIGGPPGWHIECKAVERLNVWDAMKQAERDAAPGEKPMVVMKRNRSGWLAVVRLDDLLALLGPRLDPEEAAELRAILEP